MLKNICTVLGIVSAIACSSAGGWWYLAAAEARHQICNSLLYVTSITDTQRIIDNQAAHSNKLQRQIEKLTDTLTQQYDDMTVLINTKIGEFRDGMDSSSGQMNDADKKELMDKLSVIEAAAKKSAKMTKEHSDRKEKIERMEDYRVVLGMSVALALCAFARLNDTSMSDAMPQIVALVSTWLLYYAIIPITRVDIVCVTLLLFSGFSVAGVKTWKTYGPAIKVMIRKALEQNEGTRTVATSHATLPTVDPEVQKAEKERQDRNDAMVRLEAMRLVENARANALLRDAELARGPAPPYTGPVHTQMGHPHMRQTTGYQPEYPQLNGHTFTPRGY